MRDPVRRMQTMVDNLHEVLTLVFEFNNLLEQQRTNVITLQLATWAEILSGADRHRRHEFRAYAETQDVIHLSGFIGRSPVYLFATLHPIYKSKRR